MPSGHPSPQASAPNASIGRLMVDVATAAGRRTGRLWEAGIRSLSPRWALRREQSRRILSYYEAAKPSTYHKQRREPGSGDTAVLRAGASLREQARHLEQNHDLARGALNILVANIVGQNGIGIEPHPRTRGGQIHDDLARRIEDLLRHWARRPEVTREHNWAATQRLACRTWLRDGEGLAQLLDGTAPALDHGTRVPFSIELIEADHLPFTHNRAGMPSITAGVERDAWGRPIAYHVYRHHPGDLARFPSEADLRRVPAGRLLHLKMVDRVRQARGVSIFAAVLARFEDIKDYEDSERIAAKMAASMVLYIKKGVPDMYDAPLGEDGKPQPRELRFRPGMVFDELTLGEEMDLFDTKRPNAALDAFVRGQLRRAATGLNITYSSLAKDYDGSYSSQRQELVEGWRAYEVLADEFTGRFVCPVYERLIDTAAAAGALELPADLDPATLTDAHYIAPQMPWIDPDKEGKGFERSERAGYASGPEIVRRRGRNPRDVMEEEKRWRRQWRDDGELITADPATDKRETQDDGEGTQAPEGERARRRLRD